MSDIDDQTKALIKDIVSFDTVGIIESSEDQKFAAVVLTKVKSNAKELKATKKRILDPLNEAMKEVKAQFKPAEDHLAEVEQSIKDALLAYHEEQERKAQKQIDAIGRRMDKGTLSVEKGIAKLASVDVADSNLQAGDGSVQFREGPEKVRIIDVETLIRLRPSLLSRERVLEALRIELAADIKTGSPVPRGAEVYRERTAAVRV